MRNVGNVSLYFDPATSIVELIPNFAPPPNVIKSPLVPGDSFSFTIPVQVSAGLDQLVNTIQVTGNDRQDFTGTVYTGQATVAVGIVSNPNAQLLVMQDVTYTAPVQPNSPLTFTFRVRNIGTSVVSGAHIYNPHNPAIPGLEIDPANDPTNDTLGAILVPDLQPGMTWTVTRPITVPAWWADTLLTNTTYVSLSDAATFDAADPATYEDNATSDVPVQLFTVTKALSPTTPAPILVGDPVEFTVVVTNLSTTAIAATVVDTPSMIGYTQAIPITWTPALPATFPSGTTTLTVGAIVPRFNAATLDNSVTVSADTGHGPVTQGTATASANLLRTAIDITNVRVYQRVTSGGVTTDLTTIQTGEQATAEFTVNNMGVVPITGLTHTITFDIPGVTCTPTGAATLAAFDPLGTTDSAVVSCTFTAPEALPAYKPAALTRTLTVASAGMGGTDAVQDTDTLDFDLVDLQLRA